VLRNPPDITIHAPTVFGTFQVQVSATGLLTHNIDITLPLQEQIKRLAQFANNLSRGAAELEKQIAALGRDLKKARADTAKLERKTWAHIQSQIQSLDERINSRASAGPAMGDLGSIHLFRRHRPELRDISAAVLLSAAPGGPQDLDDGVAAAPDAGPDAAVDAACGQVRGLVTGGQHPHPDRGGVNPGLGRQPSIHLLSEHEPAASHHGSGLATVGSAMGGAAS
jgi:hypothetical protein